MKLYVKTYILFTLIVSMGVLMSRAQTSSHYDFSTNRSGDFEPMNGAVTIIGSNENDNSYDPVFHDIGFHFLFMGEFWDEFKVSANGVIFFGEATDFFPAGANNVGDIPNSRRISGYAPSETGNEGGMSTTATGKVHYKLFGTYPDRYIVIEWLNMGFNRNSTTPDITYQVKLYESTGKIEFVYGDMRYSNTSTGGVSAGFQVDNNDYDRFTIHTDNDNFSYTNDLTYDPDEGVINNLNSTSNGNRKRYELTSVKPDGDAGNITVSCLSDHALLLSWDDNVSNELGYATYISTDQANYTYHDATGEDETNQIISNLNANTTYTFRVYAYTEGQLSANPQEITIQTTDQGSIHSVRNGNWSDKDTWSGAHVPDNTNDVVIGCLTGHEVRVDNNGQAHHLSVLPGSELVINNNRNLTVTGDFINEGTTDLKANNTTLNIKGHFTNHGIFFPGNDSKVSFSGNDRQEIRNSQKAFGTETYANTPDSYIYDSQGWRIFPIDVTADITALKSVTVDLANWNNENLFLYLRTPEGNFIELSTRNGGNGNGYQNVTFSDESSNNLPNGNTTLSGDYQPEQALSSYTGSINGTWSLYVRNTYYLRGHLSLFSLSFSNTSGTEDELVFHELQLNNNNSEIIMMDTDIKIKKYLDLTNGLLVSEDYDKNKLRFDHNATSKRASNQSYVRTKIEKTGNSDLIFPFGDDGYEANMMLEFNGAGDISDRFTAEYHRHNPDIINDADPLSPYAVNAKENTLETISNCEYWLIDQTQNTGTPVTVHLSFDNQRSCGVGNPTDLRVAHWTDDGTGNQLWNDEGNGGISPIGIFSDGPVNSFSPFTLGSTTLNNPLPVDWLNFTAFSKSPDNILQWEAIENSMTDLYFIQYSYDGETFTTFDEVKAQGEGTVSYELAHKDVNAAKMYYRIKQVDFNGEVSFSPVRSVSAHSSVEVSAYPNPFSEQVLVELNGSKNTEATIRLTSVTGQIIYDANIIIDSEHQVAEVSTASIQKGTYILTVTINDETQQLKLIK